MMRDLMITASNKDADELNFIQAGIKFYFTLISPLKFTRTCRAIGGLEQAAWFYDESGLCRAGERIQGCAPQGMQEVRWLRI